MPSPSSNQQSKIINHQSEILFAHGCHLVLKHSYHHPQISKNILGKKDYEKISWQCVLDSHALADYF